MHVSLTSLSKLSNPEKYTNLLDSLTKNRELLQNHLEKYSEKEDYDKILSLYDENKEIIEMFKTFVTNKELLMLDILETIKKHQDSFVKNSNIKQLSEKLGIDSGLDSN